MKSLTVCIMKTKPNNNFPFGCKENAGKKNKLKFRVKLFIISRAQKLKSPALLNLKILKFGFLNNQTSDIAKQYHELHRRVTKEKKNKGIVRITFEFLQRSHPVPTFPGSTDLDFLSPFSNKKKKKLPKENEKSNQNVFAYNCLLLYKAKFNHFSMPSSLYRIQSPREIHMYTLSLNCGVINTTVYQHS